MWKRMAEKQVNSRFRLFSAFRRNKAFARDERGATLVEFAILAVPFFTIIVAILETAVVFLAGQVLDFAVGDSVRMVRTGQAQSASYTASDFRNRICERTVGLLDCEDIKIRVRVVGDFTSTSAAEPLDPDDGTWVIVEQFQPGIGSDIVIAEAYYKWPTIVNFFGFNLSNSPDGTRLLGTARVWRNEPF